MKKLYIQVCPRARLMIEVTEEMERDFFECWDMAEHREVFKDCETCSWYGLDITCGTSACEIVAEWGSREGRIIWDD